MVGVLSACQQSDTITKSEDYLKYLQANNAMLVSSKQDEISFWKERLAKHNDDVSLKKLAGLFADEFKSSGEISFIKKSDSLYLELLNRMPLSAVSIYHGLTANAITQHKFREAESWISKALMIGDQKATSKLMLADVAMEIGAYDWTRKILKEFTNKNSFAWLIRKAKLKDHEGDLDSAIILMERAYKRIDGNKSLACWTLSNLGDMYGHAGRIEDAYQNYLQVLKLDPNYDYALKGIAWIALSNDHMAKDAYEIFNNISQNKRMPETHLMLAELAEMQGDEEERMKHLRMFKSMVDDSNYQIMYGKYLALIEADDFQNPKRCIEIAEQEIRNRPTPQSYDLLAWGYHTSGDHKRALQIVEDYVYEKTYEPECLYHIGMIYKANGFSEKGNNLLKEARESSFELGPSVSKIIAKALM